MHSIHTARRQHCPDRTNLLHFAHHLSRLRQLPAHRHRTSPAMNFAPRNHPSDEVSRSVEVDAAAMFCSALVTQGAVQPKLLRTRLASVRGLDERVRVAVATRIASAGG
jgi:hypothetical protein